MLRPEPGKASSFNEEQSIPFNWNVHLLGSASKIMAEEELGINIWDPNPYLHVYVGEGIRLDEIEIPDGVEVLEIADLQTRYAKCLASSDRTVRGWSCGHIARLDPYNADSMRKIATMLDDDDIPRRSLRTTRCTSPAVNHVDFRNGKNFGGDPPQCLIRI